MFGTKFIGRVIGILQGGPIAAGVVGPLVMGLIFDLHGHYTAAIWGTHRHQRTDGADVPGDGLARRVGQTHRAAADRR